MSKTEPTATRFVCSECNRHVTRGPSGIEYGHVAGIRGDTERCPRRPSAVDTKREAHVGGGER